MLIVIYIKYKEDDYNLRNIIEFNSRNLNFIEIFF